MVISNIEAGENVYYSLHAEQIMSSTFFEADSGIYASELFGEALNRVKENANAYVSKNIVLDFARIENVSKQLKSILSEISKNCRLLILRNLSDLVFNQLDISEIGDNLHNERTENNDGYVTFYFKEKADKIDISNEDQVFEDAFLKTLLKYTDENKSGYHQSSSVYLSKYIDMKKIISHEKNFFIYALYRLALQTRSKWFDELEHKKTRPILICQNLNSSYIASILSSLLKLNVLILDHLGPINTMYSSLNRKIEENKNYLIVSDVVCLGTEVKIAKNLITFLGGKVIGNISIVKLDTLEQGDIEVEEKKLKTLSVFNINRENNKLIDFQIKTALI